MTETLRNGRRVAKITPRSGRWKIECFLNLASDGEPDDLENVGGRLFDKEIPAREWAKHYLEKGRLG